MDEENKRKRDLSKAISLNKENSEISYEKAINNYSLFQYHFNPIIQQQDLLCFF